MIRACGMLAVVMALPTIDVAAQGTTTSEGDQFLARAINTSMLTYDGKPFHAVMELTPREEDSRPSPGAAYTGKVEVLWVSANKYRVSATSPSFTLDRLVVAGDMQEKHTGDFYPRWLETFVKVLTDPVPVAQFSSAAGATFSGATQMGSFSMEGCIRRDDKVAGITNDLTWGQLCFTGPVLNSITSFNYSVYMADWQPFAGKDIAREYHVFVLDSRQVAGHLTTLEALAPEDSEKIVVLSPTPVADLIGTRFISTLTEESMVDHAPKLVWPAIREGKTEGYMIVYARTDSTGQVRESGTHNSDNPGLEPFGMQQALGYKFKPLIVEGVAQQMEMPLVLHFTSKVDNPIPIFTVAEMKKQTISCHPDPVSPHALSAGQRAIVRVTVDANGNIIGNQPQSQAPWGMLLRPWTSVKACRFRPYVVNGMATVYKGDVELH